jgi:O-antigen ligase
VALLFCLYARRGGLLIAVVVAVVVIGFGLQATNLLPGVVGSRLAQIVEYVGWYDVSEIVPNAQNWAVIERMAHWQAAWNMYETHALLGVGPGHYALAYPDYRVNDFWKDPLGHAHNLYLNLMAEDGFFGILAYAILWLSWLVVIWRSYRRGVDPRDRALAAGALAGFIAVAIHGFFDNLTVHGLGTQMGILIGLAASTTGPADASGESS